MQNVVNYKNTMGRRRRYWKSKSLAQNFNDNFNYFQI